jgi:hypothetical protein
MDANRILIAIAGTLALSGCSSFRVVNSGNTNCEFRLDSDRQRCLQATRSNERIMEEQLKAKRDAKKSLGNEIPKASAPEEKPLSMPTKSASQPTNNETL